MNNTLLHEVAHAVVGQHFGLGVVQVGVDATGGGYCSFDKLPTSDFAKACIFYAGYYAESIVDESVNFNHRRFILDQIEVDETGYEYEEIEEALDILFDVIWVQILDWTARLS